MLHPAAAMLRSPSSLLRLSHRLQLHLLRPVTPRLPSPPLSARPRSLSSSSSSSSSPPDGVGWTTYDPLTDTLGPVSAGPSASTSASDSETPAEKEAWGVYDPVAGRIVKQDASPPAPSSSSSDNDDGEVGEERGNMTRIGGMGLGGWSAVAAPRKSAGKASRLRGSDVCSNCKEGFSQWWGICPNCQAVGTLDQYVATARADTGSTGESQSHNAVHSWIPQKIKEMVPQSHADVNNGFNHAEWSIQLTGTFGMEIAHVLGGGIVPDRFKYVGGLQC